MFDSVSAEFAKLGLSELAESIESVVESDSEIKLPRLSASAVKPLPRSVEDSDPVVSAGLSETKLPKLSGLAVKPLPAESAVFDSTAESIELGLSELAESIESVV